MISEEDHLSDVAGLAFRSSTKGYTQRPSNQFETQEVITPSSPRKMKIEFVESIHMRNSVKLDDFHYQINQEVSDQE